MSGAVTDMAAAAAGIAPGAECPVPGRGRIAKGPNSAHPLPVARLLGPFAIRPRGSTGHSAPGLYQQLTASARK